MSGFEVYQSYLSIKLHFSSNTYDFFKYGIKKVNIITFQNRKDRVFFEKLAKIEDYHEFLIANLSDNPKLWIRDLAYSESAQLKYQNWKKRNQSITYTFKNEFKKILEEPGNQHHPAALRLYLANEISLESLCIFCIMTNSVEQWDSKLEYDPIWEEYRKKIIKYTPFVKFERDKIKNIMIDIMNDMGYTK